MMYSFSPDNSVSMHGLSLKCRAKVNAPSQKQPLRFPPHNKAGWVPRDLWPIIMKTGLCVIHSY